MAKKPEGPVYQLKVTLTHSKPPIWRRIEVPRDMTLAKLHLTIQVAMGWENYHMHQFIADGIYYGEPQPEWDFDVKNERRVRLHQVLKKPKHKLVYEYDFGDGWEHEVLLEKIVEPEPQARYPRCIAGKRRCPPEDVGGVWGYANFLEAIQDSNHPEHEMYMEWIGGSFDAEAFDLDAVNKDMRYVR